MFPLHENKEGSFQELAHSNDVEFGQLSILKINPRCTRGGHYHKVKKEWFCCIRGECEMELQNIKDGKFRHVLLDALHSEFVLINPYESHSITNLGDELCEVLIIVSESYDPENPDTYEYAVHSKVLVC
jgi:dTDP-4-dehydrorhamnose 3,5-epimerase-like enzyme